MPLKMSFSSEVVVGKEEYVEEYMVGKEEYMGKL